MELTLKAALLHAGVDYPKIHDVGARFAAIAAVRPLALAEAEVAQIVTASAAHARLRGPVFYAERESTEEEAREAAAQGEMVFALLAPRLLPGAPG